MLSTSLAYDRLTGTFAGWNPAAAPGDGQAKRPESRPYVHFTVNECFALFSSTPNSGDAERSVSFRKEIPEDLGIGWTFD